MKTVSIHILVFPVEHIEEKSPPIAKMRIIANKIKEVVSALSIEFSDV